MFNYTNAKGIRADCTMRKKGARMTNADLLKLVGRRVHVTFKDGGSSLCGTLCYADKFGMKHNFRKPKYFYIGNVSFKVSHLKKVIESEE